MPRKKKISPEEIEEQLDREILDLINVLVYRMVQKAYVREGESLENRAIHFIFEYLVALHLITKLFGLSFEVNMGIRVPDVLKEWAKKIVEGKDVNELIDEMKELLEDWISQGKTTRKAPREPEYISFTSFTTDDKWKRF